MLKIRDEIDLKELEKFGFREIKGVYRIISKKSVMPSEKMHISKHYAITVFKNRRIQIAGSGKDNTYEILFELIQAGLVEKVEG